jgi:hypothetical protein
MPSAVKKITPVLLVDAIEPCLPFWVDLLGWSKTVEAPHDGRAGFVILVKNDVELMYQTRACVRDDVPALGDAPAGGALLYLETSDLDAVERALHGSSAPIVVPRRRTFYGMNEIGVREPGGNVVLFAQPSE